MAKGVPTWITYHETTDHIAGWARRRQMSPKTLWRRLHLGWSIQEALTTPSRVPRTARAARPPDTSGLAPHIAGPAIAIAPGQWVPASWWLEAREHRHAVQAKETR